MHSAVDHRAEFGVRVDALRVVRVVTLPPLVRNKYGDLVAGRGAKLLQQFLCLRLIRARDVALRLEFVEAHHKHGGEQGKVLCCQLIRHKQEQFELWNGFRGQTAQKTGVFGTLSPSVAPSENGPSAPTKLRIAQ